MVDVADGTDVDVRLAALEGSGVAPGRVDKLSLSPGTEGGLDGVGGLLAQSTRGAEESPSERHVDRRRRSNERQWTEGGEMGEEVMVAKGLISTWDALENLGHVPWSARLHRRRPHGRDDRRASSIGDAIAAIESTASSWSRLCYHAANETLPAAILHRRPRRCLQPTDIYLLFKRKALAS